MMKACSKCDEIKSAEGFHRNRQTRDGLQSQCKICCKQYNRSEKRKQYNRSEKYKQSQRQYRQSEKGKQIRQQAQRQYEQSEKYKQYKRKGENVRRTRKTQAGGSYTPAEWYNLCKFYDFHCLRCNIEFPFKDLSMDHIKPVIKGGPSFIWNAQPLCGPCNSKKGNKEMDYRQTLPDWINRDGPIWMQRSLF